MFIDSEKKMISHKLSKFLTEISFLNILNFMKEPFKDDWIPLYLKTSCLDSGIDFSFSLFTNIAPSFATFESPFERCIRPESGISIHQRGQNPEKIISDVSALVWKKESLRSRKKEESPEVFLNPLIYLNERIFLNKSNNTYIYVDNDGYEEILAESIEGEIWARLTILRKVLNAIGDHILILYFSLRVEGNNIDTILPDWKPGLNIYEEYFLDTDYIPPHPEKDRWGGKGLSYFEGKRIINLLSKEPAPLKFILDMDKNDHPILKDLSTLSGNSLKILHFSVEVLDKYRRNNYCKVDARSLQTPGFYLQLTNQNNENVSVFAYKIADLPFKEQEHWAKYNISPNESTKITDNELRPIAYGIPTNPEQPDYVLKKLYIEVIKKWQQKYGFPFFTHLDEKNQSRLEGLRMAPDYLGEAEFDKLITDFHTLLIEHLNDKDIQEKLALQNANYKIKKKPSVEEKLEIVKTYLEKIMGENKSTEDFLKISKDTINKMRTDACHKSQKSDFIKEEKFLHYNSQIIPITINFLTTLINFPSF